MQPQPASETGQRRAARNVPVLRAARQPQAGETRRTGRDPILLHLGDCALLSNGSSAQFCAKMEDDNSL